MPSGIKKETGKGSRFRHGMSLTRFHKIWRKIIGRCLCKTDKAYYRYGGRGIGIYKRWEKFENFRDDMYQSYLDHVNKFGEKETSIDRIDNNKGYFKENCRWVISKEQANNRRSNHLITYRGKTLNLSQWAELIGMKYFTLFSRINQYKWSPEKAFNTPIKNK